MSPSWRRFIRIGKIMLPERESGVTMEYKFRQWYIPTHMIVALRRYIDEHCPVEGFLTAVLSNNLREACRRADEENLANLPAFVAYLYNAAPGDCWGSPEKVEEWLTARNVCPIPPLPPAPPPKRVVKEGERTKGSRR